MSATPTPHFTSRQKQKQEDARNRFGFVEGTSVPLSTNDRVILVMGPTGAGKSTFIKAITGQNTGIGHNLSSEAVVALYYLERPGYQRICLVDTPGFDDARGSDADVLETVATWLAATYSGRIIPAGILFLHRISDRRMHIGPLKSLKLFRKLCGEDCLKNVVLVTTMWSQVDPENGRERENDLSTNFWKPLIERGSQVARFKDDYNSALEIVSLLDKHIPLPLLVQNQMVDKRMTLADTSVGITVDGDLGRENKEHKQAILELRKERNRNIRTGNDKFRKLAEEEIEKVKEEHGRTVERRRMLKRNLWKWLANGILSASKFHLKA